MKDFLNALMISAVVFVVCGTLVYWTVHTVNEKHDRWEQHCRDRGGVVTDTRSGDAICVGGRAEAQ